MVKTLTGQFVSPRARKRIEEYNIPIHELHGTGPNGRIIEADVIDYIKKRGIHLNETTHNQFDQFGFKQVTPLARKIAKTENIDLKAIQGSGFRGKIKSSDVLKVLNANQSKLSKREVPLSGIRKVIATRMTESKRTAPHVTLSVKVDATKLVKLRKALLEKYTDIRITYTDLLLKIVSQSLLENPKVNVSLIENTLVFHDDINIGIAVAIEDGLVVPVIQNVHQKSIVEIHQEVSDKVERAKSGKLKESDFKNGRFTISNLGMYEVDVFTPIINPPESAILGVGRIIEDIFVKNEQIRIGYSMVLSLSFDHRVMDGAPAAVFLGHIKDLIENPEKLDIM